MSPLPRTRVIPRDWSTHHAPIVTGAFNARAVVLDPNLSEVGELDPETGTHDGGTPHYVIGGPEDPVVDWRGGVPLRLQQLIVGRDQDVDLAGETINLRNYLAQFPFEAPPLAVGLTVRFTEVSNDPELVGKDLTVTGTVLGSERFSRDVFLEFNQGAAR